MHYDHFSGISQNPQIKPSSNNHEVPVDPFCIKTYESLAGLALERPNCGFFTGFEGTRARIGGFAVRRPG